MEQFFFSHTLFKGVALCPTLWCIAIKKRVFGLLSTMVSQFIYKGGLKSSYDDVLSVVDDFFDQWDQGLQYK